MKYCKQQESLMDTRVRDMVQITKMVLDAMKAPANNTVLAPANPMGAVNTNAVGGVVNGLNTNAVGGVVNGLNANAVGGAVNTNAVGGVVNGLNTNAVGGAVNTNAVGGGLNGLNANTIGGVVNTNTIGGGLNGLNANTVNVNGMGGTMTGAEAFAAREKEGQLKALLHDCDELISLYLADLQTRSDPRLVRTAAVDALLQRVRSATLTGPTAQWTSTEILLVLQRLKEKESQLLAVQEKYDLLIRDMMRVENERDEMKKKAVEAETQAGVAKQELQQKETELETWKQIANRSGGGGAYPLLGSSPAVATNPYAITPYSTWEREWNVRIRTAHSEAEIDALINRVRTKVMKLWCCLLELLA